ncbi:MAG TPA: tetratricopeptide repeat protein, partial [Gemmatimonadales bacterium]|nr:tetratricopeptide repeat protein [Gemmatimonadales bacterium]
TENALRIARDGVAAYPNNPVLQNNLAVLLEVTGDVQGAETLLRAALSEDAALPQVSKNLGDILYRNGRYDEAAEAYERAAKLNPELGDDLYFKLGNIAYKRRDHARARASWAQATSLNPGHQLARANLEMLELSQ